MASALHLHLSTSLGKSIGRGHALSLGALEGNAGMLAYNSLRDSLSQLNYALPDTTELELPHMLSPPYLNATVKPLQQEGGKGMNSLQDMKVVQGNDAHQWL